MTSPDPRGGFGAALRTTLAAPAAPTRAGSTPRSASVQVVTGFFLPAMIDLNDGYLASPDWSVTDTRAGRVATTSSTALSASRRIVTAPLSTDSALAKVTWGTPSRSASIAGRTDISPSVDAIPHTTRSKPILSSALESTREVDSESDPCNAS